jgi:hypothetical protein
MDVADTRRNRINIGRNEVLHVLRARQDSLNTS